MSTSVNDLNVVDDSILLNSQAMGSKQTPTPTTSEPSQVTTPGETTVPDVEPFADQNVALNVLVQAVYIGQQRGAWKLEESILLKRAINSFKPATPPTPPTSTTTPSS